MQIYYCLGRHCCLWCHITYKEIQNPPQNRVKQYPPRTLESLQEDYSKFLKVGKGDLKVAKMYNNVIQPYLFDIPLDRVIKHTHIPFVVAHKCILGLSSWPSHVPRHL